MYTKGTKIYDEVGRLYATLTRDVFVDDPIFPEQFEFHQEGVSVETGDPIPDPIWKFSQGEGYKSQEALDGSSKDH